MNLNNDDIFKLLLSISIPTIILYYTKPSMFFLPDGSEKPVSFTAINKDTTIIPYWLASIFGGIIIFNLWKKIN